MTTTRATFALTLAVAAIGCKPRATPGRDAGPAAAGAVDAGGASPADLARCLASFERAGRLPPAERAGAIVRGCPVCGRPWDPVIVADRADEGAPVDREEVWRVIQACGGACTRGAAAELKAGLADLAAGRPATGPWRKLAAACPAPLRADDHSGRFVGAVWYAMATITERMRAARPTLPPTEQGRLDAAQAALLLPLPPLSTVGTGFVVPPGGVRPGTPWLQLTITDQATYVGWLPFADLAPDGLRVLDGGVPYPGTRVPAGGLAAALDQLVAAAMPRAPALPDRIDRPVLIAPRAAPARRVLETLAALGTHQVSLAVSVAAPAGLWRGLIGAQPMPLAASAPTGPRLRFGLGSLRVAAIDASGKVRASAALPFPDRPVAERWRAVANSVATDRVIELLAEDAVVADLAAVLDGLAGAGATVAIPAPAGARVTGSELATFDVARLREVTAP